MAWTTPFTFVGSPTIHTVAQWQTIRDNLNYLKTVGDSSITQIDSFTGSVNNFALTTGVRVLYCTGASLRTYTGFAAGVDSQQLLVINKGTSQVDFLHNSGSSTTPFTNIATSGTTSLAAGGSAGFEYDATSSRWRMVHHEQGAWISPAFAAGDYTGNGAMTWTVAAGDVITYKYRLSGRTMTVAYYVQTSTVGGTLNTALQVKVPGGFTTVGTVVAIGASGDNTATFVPAYVQTNSTVIQHFKSIVGAGNWAAATDTTYVNATITFDVT